MQIDVNNLQREPQFRVVLTDHDRPDSVAPQDDPRAGPVTLHWAGALDAQGVLRQCPVCQCNELFVRRDFPQGIGLAVVVVCAIASAVLFFIGWILASMGVLLAAVLVDRVISFFTGRCLVCYRCRSEFRKLEIPNDYPTWDLSTGEKYRDAPDQH